jgi:Mor family transcriptional regulator
LEKTDEILEHQGEKWSELEEQQLLNEIEIGMDYNAIAKNHSRTCTAIRKRIRHVIYELHSNGISTKELVERMKLPEEEIVSIIQCYIRNHENKQRRNDKKIEKELVIHPLQIAPSLPSEADHDTTEVDVVKTELASVKTDLASVKKELTIIKTEVRSLTKMMKHLTMILESIYDIETPP